MELPWFGVDCSPVKAFRGDLSALPTSGCATSEKLQPGSGRPVQRGTGLCFTFVSEWTKLCLKSDVHPSLLPQLLATTAEDPQGLEMNVIGQMFIQKLSRQLLLNTKKGRWQSPCLPNEDPWLYRPPWMPTLPQIPLPVQKMKAQCRVIPREPPLLARAASTWSIGSVRPSMALPHQQPPPPPLRVGAVGQHTGWQMSWPRHT